jgi:hypothetical protein
MNDVANGGYLGGVVGNRESVVSVTIVWDLEKLIVFLTDLPGS